MRLLLATIAAVCVLSSTVSNGEPVTTPYFVDLSDPKDQSPALIGGTVQDPKQWPASPWVGNCSSTLIGDRVLLTAAHCVSNGGSKTFTIGTTRYSSKCTHHADYRRNSTADWALCLVDKVISDTAFEAVATEAEAACAPSVNYLWTGYGCQRWGGGIDGKFRAGLVATISCPKNTNYDVVTRGSVALCSGDSGGGGYVVMADGARKVVGVNSRSNTTDTSYVSNTFGQKFRTWAKSWADEKQTKICGIHADATSCRGGGSDPDPDPDPKDCKDHWIKVDQTLTAHGVALEAVKQCEAQNNQK